MLYIYKTNIENKSDVDMLRNSLDQILGSEKWNIDLNDCDKVFRMESVTEADMIKALETIRDRGFHFDELL